MTNFKFNAALFLLAVTFVFFSYLAELNADYLRSITAIGRALLGMIVVTPFILTMLVCMIRVKALEHDEYQANMLQQRMIYAVGAAMLYSLMKGFIDQYGETQNAPFYIWPAVYWYLTFWFSGLLGPYKP